jgi:TolB-like protein/cytochrome c-type biogenesis protein CcmH/NrfG
MSLFLELKRRNVFRVGIAYAIVAWLVLQVADLVLENIDAPAWVMQVFMLAVAIGLPLVLVFAWAFELTPEGIKREKDVDRDASIAPRTGQKLNRSIAVLLVLALGYIAYDIGRDFLRDTGGAGNSSATSAQPAETALSAETTSEAGRRSPADESTELATRDNSIAVLPFANRSLRQEDLFFTDGIHDDLLTQLAKISGLKVISRTTVMKYRGADKSIPEIAAELGVATILEGGIQRAGNRVRINAQLIDVTTDEHLWAETFDREMTVENIFDIQSEITRQIVTAVRGELSDTESAQLAQKPTDNLEAYEAYLQARLLINRADYDQNNYIQAQEWLERALALDPEYAAAWAQMVVVNGQAVWIGYDNTPERVQAAADALANARRIAPDSSDTLAAEGEYLYRIDNNFPAAVSRFQSAHELAPGNGDILERLGVAQRRAGMFDAALDNFRSVIDLDPGNSRTPTLLADTLLALKRYDEARPLIDGWVRQFPDARDMRGLGIRTYMYGAGDLTSARALLNTLEPWPANEYFVISIELPMLERDYQAVIDTYESSIHQDLLKNRGYVGADAFYVGLAHRMLGNGREAQEWFDRKIELLTGLEPTGTNTDAFELMALALVYAGKSEFDLSLSTMDRAVEIIRKGNDAIFGADMAAERALILGMAGRRDEALTEIERLLTGPATHISRWNLYLNPKWDFFRDDERFNALVRPEGAE